VTLCDPACGSGAFLIAAYDWFLNHRLSLLDDLSHVEPGDPDCAGSHDDWIERSAPIILQNNLYGVDISPESVEIAQLSLWIRTARPGQPLTDLSPTSVAATAWWTIRRSPPGPSTGGRNSRACSIGAGLTRSSAIPPM